MAEMPFWLSAWQSAGVPRADALRLFGGLAHVAPEAMIGRWKGRTLPTGHPLDGLLEALGWHGKEVETPERVHPLLFRRPSGDIVPLEPALMPTGIALRWPGFARSLPMRLAFAGSGPLLRARRPGARLAYRDFLGLRSPALIYHAQPIADHLRLVSDDLVVGLMERRGMEMPFFFLLTRNGGP